jgi:hypothetical protein
MKSSPDSVLDRLPGLPISPGPDVLVSEFHAIPGSSGRWLFIRFHCDGSAAVIRFDAPLYHGDDDENQAGAHSAEPGSAP